MEWLKEWVVWIFRYIHQTTYELGELFLDEAFELLPQNSSGDIKEIMGGYWHTADSWLPMTEAIAVFGTLLAFNVSIITLRWILKFIPMIG